MDNEQFKRCYRYGPYRRQIARCVNRKTRHYETREDIRQDIWLRVKGCSDTSTGLVSQAIDRETNASYLRAWRAWDKEKQMVELANQFVEPLSMFTDPEIST